MALNIASPSYTTPPGDPDRPQRVSWAGGKVSWAGRTLLFGLILLLVLATAPSGRAATAVVRAQPLLLELAAGQPEAVVRVIAQLGDDAVSAADLVARLDGQYVMDLELIAAFAAEMTAASAARLATSPAVRWVSVDAPVVSSNGPGSPFDTTNTFLETIGAAALHDDGLDGEGVTVAIVDSGITPWEEFEDEHGALRILDSAVYAGEDSEDLYGHGTHIAATIGGNGVLSDGIYTGVAPGVNLVNVKISDDQGMSYISDLIAGLEWVYDNRDLHNIRVLNLSLNSTVPESYHTSPLDAALEILWFNGIVVVVSAGNNGASSGVLYPPANDPFVITVGASDELGTGDRSDDVVAPFTAYGLTGDGFAKPEIIAPGRHIIALIGGADAYLAEAHPDRLIGEEAGYEQAYFRLSGTSMATAVTTGAVALLLQEEPDLTPDQVKYRLLESAGTISLNSFPATVQFPYLDVEAAVNGGSMAAANQGISPSALIFSGGGAIVWDSVNWEAVAGTNVAWNSVAWNSVAWND